MRISDWSSALCSSDLARGLELDPENVAADMARGLSVVQGDDDTDLGYYQDDSFDYAILSENLQTTKRPDLVIGHLLRIGRQELFSFPHFANLRVSHSLRGEGQTPVTRSLPDKEQK